MYSQKVTEGQLAEAEAAWAAQIPGFKIREYSLPEVEEWETRLAAGDTSPEAQAYMVHELVRCTVDFTYWADRYAWIHNDKGLVRRCQIWASQRMLLQKIGEAEEKDSRAHVMVAALKGRQEGLTTISQMIMAHRLMLHQGTRGLSASNVEAKTFELYQFLNRIYDHLPGWMQPGVADRVKAKHMVFPKLHSKSNYAWSNQADPIGQGQTLDMVHLTEVSTWENPGYIRGDIQPAYLSSQAYLPIFIAESTGAGAKGNYFADLYLGARKGSDFTPIFISPFDLPNKYSADPEGVELSAVTLAVADRWLRETGRELSKGQLAWYQKTRRGYESTGELETFFQEYPTCEEEAFQVGLKSVFSLELRSKLRDKVRSPEAIYDVNFNTGKLREAEDDLSGFNRVTFWEMPAKGALYVMGVDASWGLGGDNDNAAIEIIRVGTKERPDEQVAEFYGDASPSQLANIAYTMGHVYTDKVEGLPAMAAVESQPGSPGAITQEELIRKGYLNFYTWQRFGRRPGENYTNILGWYTSAQSRPVLTQAGTDAIKGEDLWVNSTKILEEMATFVAHEKRFGLTNLKHLGHAMGYHDDCLFALFIAFYTAHEKELGVMAAERRAHTAKGLETKPEEDDALEYARTHDIGMTFEEAFGDRWTYLFQ